MLGQPWPQQLLHQVKENRKASERHQDSLGFVLFSCHRSVKGAQTQTSACPLTGINANRHPNTRLQAQPKSSPGFEYLVLLIGLGLLFSPSNAASV